VVEAQLGFSLEQLWAFNTLSSIPCKSKVGDYQEDWRVRVTYAAVSLGVILSAGNASTEIAQRTTRRNIDPSGEKRELFGINPRCAKKIKPGCTEFKGRTRLSKTTEKD
jgi:hypothetical protein